MRPLSVIAMIAMVVGQFSVVEAGLFRPWWRSADSVCATGTACDCPDVCADSTGCLTDDSCCSSAGWTPVMSHSWLSKPRHWLRDVCGDVCCSVDLSAGCTEAGLPEFCCDQVPSRCVGKSDACRLAELMYCSQTAELPRMRRQAYRQIGQQFDSRCFPEVFLALECGLRDCHPAVRETAAEELGKQWKRTCGCVPGSSVQALRCALSDCDRRVRRQAAQSLRSGGHRLLGCAEIGYIYRGCTVQEDCLGCVDTFASISEENTGRDSVNDSMLEEYPSAHRWHDVLPALRVPARERPTSRTPAAEDAEAPQRQTPGNKGYIPIEASTHFLMPLQMPQDRISQREL